MVDEAYLLLSREQRMREMLALPVHPTPYLVKIEAWLILRSYCGNPFRVLVWVAGKNIQYLWWEICALIRGFIPGSHDFPEDEVIPDEQA